MLDVGPRVETGRQAAPSSPKAQCSGVSTEEAGMGLGVPGGGSAGPSLSWGWPPRVPSQPASPLVHPGWAAGVLGGVWVTSSVCGPTWYPGSHPFSAPRRLGAGGKLPSCSEPPFPCLPSERLEG